MMQRSLPILLHSSPCTWGFKLCTLTLSKEFVQCLTQRNSEFNRTVQKKRSGQCRWMLTNLYHSGVGLPNWCRILGAYLCSFLAWRFLVWPLVAFLQPCSFTTQLLYFALCGELAAGISRRSLKTTKIFKTVARCRFVKRRRVKMARRCHICIAPSLICKLQSLFASKPALCIIFGNNCMFVSRCYDPHTQHTHDVKWNHLSHLRGGGGGGAAATARKRQEKLLHGLQTLLQEFMPNHSQPQTTLPKDKKKKQRNDLVGALHTLLQRHTDGSKRREQQDLLVALQRLVKAATDGKIPLEDRPKPKPPEQPHNVAKAKAKPGSQRSDKFAKETQRLQQSRPANTNKPTSTWADIAKTGNTLPKQALTKRPSFQLWKPPDDPFRKSEKPWKKANALSVHLFLPPMTSTKNSDCFAKPMS